MSTFMHTCNNLSIRRNKNIEIRLKTKYAAYKILQQSFSNT